MMTFAQAVEVILMLARIVGFSLFLVIVSWLYNQLRKAPAAEDIEDQERRTRNDQLAREAVWEYQNSPRSADAEFEGESPLERDIIERGRDGA